MARAQLTPSDQQPEIRVGYKSEMFTRMFKTENAMYSPTEVELIEFVLKSIKKVGLKDTQRIALFFTPALRINEGILSKDFNASDTDLGTD